MSDDATARRKQLGRLLRRAREAAHLTQEVVAGTLGCRQAKITKIETTLVGIDSPDLEKMIELYNLPAAQAEELRTLAELDQQDSPARTKPLAKLAAYDELSETEPEAREIRCWHSERIPGPLQSQIYRLKLHGLQPTDTEAVTRVLRELTARTQVFTAADPPRYRVILSESSLHRLPGGRTTEMVVDQSGHLLKLMDEHELFELRILTFDAVIPYVDTDFQLLTFDDPDRCDFVYIEYPGGSRKCKTPAELAECREHWASLDKAALNMTDSREFLEGLIRQAGSTSY
jgi:transcriptional regulator with XRE-family HTH domain